MAAEELQAEAMAAYFKALANPKRLHLLRFLIEPHHLEEIASHLGVARQTAHEHVQQLLETGLVQRREGRGETKPVVDYVVAPQRLFHLYEMVGRLGHLEPKLDAAPEVRAVTLADREGRAPPRERDLPRLVVVYGMRVGQTTTLAGDGPWLLGRDPHASVSLDYDSYASARHAEVRRAGGGGFLLADAYSSNGTFVDWRPVPRGGTTPLENGAVIRAGRTLVLFRERASAARD